MKVTDLTHMIHGEMPVYPGTEGPILRKANTLEKDGFQEVKMTMYSHTGTHIDAPAHMIQGGPFLNDLDIGHFIGTAAILDFSELGSDRIGLSDLKAHEELIRRVEFVLLRTGWSRYWGKSEYFGTFPSMTDEAGAWIAGLGLKGVGIDAISVDGMDTKTFGVHKQILPKNMIIIENLTNLDQIKSETFLLSVLPLKTEEADGSPVRAVGIEL